MMVVDINAVKPTISEEPPQPMNKIVHDMFSKSLNKEILEKSKILITQNLGRKAVKYYKLYLKKIVTSDAKTRKLFQNTIKQSECGEWHTARGPLMTASNVWDISQGQKPHTRLNYWRKKSVNNKYTRHGKRCEPFARKKLLESLQSLYPNCIMVDSGKHFQLISKNRTIIIQIGKNYWDLEICRKS